MLLLIFRCTQLVLSIACCSYSLVWTNTTLLTIQLVVNFAVKEPGLTRIFSLLALLINIPIVVTQLVMSDPLPLSILFVGKGRTLVLIIASYTEQTGHSWGFTCVAAYQSEFICMISSSSFACTNCLLQDYEPWISSLAQLASISFGSANKQLFTWYYWNNQLGHFYCIIRFFFTNLQSQCKFQSRCSPSDTIIRDTERARAAHGSTGRPWPGTAWSFLFYSFFFFFPAIIRNIFSWSSSCCS